MQCDIMAPSKTIRRKMMKYMVSWKIPSASYADAVGSFLAGDGDPPEGLSTVGRWHAPGSAYGWHLVEGDIDALAAHSALWARYVELEITPVIEDEAAGGSLASIYG